MTYVNLIDHPWIPVLRANGASEFIAPFDITAQHGTNPVVSFAWPRPDFDLASHELLIGLLAAVYPAVSKGESVTLFRQPPASEQLRERLAPLAGAFVLDGGGPRFLQDFDTIDGETWPTDSLLIDAPGANALKLNKDLFVKRGQARVLSRAVAAMALYTLQQFAPAGGAGHRTSLRGGGPLVTLALPDDGKAGATLWQTLWLNTPSNCKLDPSARERAFPWLAKTLTSAHDKTVHYDEGRGMELQALFGMPRRIRLIFAANTEQRPCDLTGVLDDIVCTGFTTAPWGTNYGVWRHPLTPYYRPKAKSDGADLPVHAPEGRLGYRQWLGLVYEGGSNGSLPARAILDAQKRLIDLDGTWKDHSRLVAGGYAMDNMKALAFAETQLPLHRLEHDPDLAKSVAKFAELMVGSSTVAVRVLGIAIRRALFGDKTAVGLDRTLIESARERFWEITEQDFHDTLDRAIGQLADDPEGNRQEELALSWRKIVRDAAYAIFDDTVPIDDFDVLEAKDLIEGRKTLFFAMESYGKHGVEFFKALGLQPKEPKKKAKS